MRGKSKNKKKMGEREDICILCNQTFKGRAPR